ncbi:dimer_Tnp_hAT domain-containing protein [Trichonephila clavipes]|nr:dimer_Tnp_hAT domain-containing protein [Trichonephila clavipes]
MYPDGISFDKLNLSQFYWLEIEEFEMQLIDFQSSSIWIQKFIETRKKLELIEAEKLTRNRSSFHFSTAQFRNALHHLNRAAWLNFVNQKQLMGDSTAMETKKKYFHADDMYGKQSLMLLEYVDY